MSLQLSSSGQTENNKGFFCGFQVRERWAEGQIKDNKCHNCYKIIYCETIRQHPGFLGRIHLPDDDLLCASFLVSCKCNHFPFKLVNCTTSLSKGSANVRKLCPQSTNPFSLLWVCTQIAVHLQPGSEAWLLPTEGERRKCHSWIMHSVTKKNAHCSLISSRNAVCKCSQCKSPGSWSDIRTCPSHSSLALFPASDSSGGSLPDCEQASRTTTQTDRTLNPPADL